MKTCQGTGYFQQVQLRLLLCFISSVVFASSAFAFTAPNSIDQCYDCHGSPIIPNGTDIRPVDAAWRNITTGGFIGSHQKHIPAPTTASVTCTPCHGAAPTAMDHRDGRIAISLTNPGTYSKGAFFNQTSVTTPLGTCSGVSCHASAYSTATVVSPSWGDAAGCAACHSGAGIITVLGPDTGSHTKHTASTCVDCHNAGTTQTTAPTAGHADGNIDVIAGYPPNVTKHAAGTYTGTCSTATCHANVYGTGNVVTPTWGVAAGCAACHSGAGVIGASGPVTGSHTKHSTSVCTDCHNAGTSATTSPTTGHADGNIDVIGGYPANVTKHAIGTYTGTCSTASCHANVYGPGTVVTPTWGVASGCAACHSGAGVIGASGPVTGSHTKHATAVCTDCHNAGTTATTSPTTGHADGNIDVIAGYPANVTKHASGTYTGRCSTACHNASSTSVGILTPTWGQPANCTSCHASSPATGSHTRHLSGLGTNFNRNALCADCHTGAVIDSNGGPGHGDNNIDVSNGSYPTNRVKGSAFATCTTSYCHSSGTAVYKPATWGTPNAAGCNFCHDALPTTLSHTIHIGGGANYSFGCAECHGHNGTGTAHNDGVINVVGTVGYNGSKQCTTSDCHSNGKAVIAYATSPAWGGTFTGDRCAACHGNWPTGDAHSAHIVGIHFDDVYKNTGGKIPQSATVASATNAAHGNALYSTTISCNICHSTVVTVPYNDNSPSCNTAGTCHASGGAGALKGSLTTASVSKTLHVNRTRDVSFAAATIRSKAQVRDDITSVPELNNFWTRTNAYKTGATSHDASKALLSTAGYAAGTCSAVVCHNGISVAWTAGAISCDKCHTALP